jgi:hypothetical protein
LLGPMMKIINYGDEVNQGFSHDIGAEN